MLRVRGPHNRLHVGLKSALLLVLVMASTSVFSYGQRTVDKMVDSAVWLAPPSLKGFLSVYKKQIAEGAAEVMEAERATPRSQLCQRLEEEMASLPRTASKQPSFEQIAYRFGRAAGLVFLLNDPLRDSGDEKVADIRDDYKKYIEKKIEKQVLNFDGYDAPRFERPACGYFDKRSASFSRYVESVLFCYYPEGKKVSSQTFDDRSNAFGVAQRVLSKSVSDTAKIWLEIWKAMDGDVSGTPFLKREGKKK